MKIKRNTPARIFSVGRNASIQLKDCAKIALNPDEQVTFTTPSRAEYDVVRKNWGFYATPSINGRLKSFGLRCVLVRNHRTDRFFVLLVEKGKESSANRYLKEEEMEIVSWLDTKKALRNFEKRSRKS